MKPRLVNTDEPTARYESVLDHIAGIIDSARRSAARSVNAVMTAAYWLIGRHLVEIEQSGEERAAYGANLIERLATDMTQRFGRGFSRQNLWQMRQFGLAYAPERILQTLSGESRDSSAQTICQTPSGKFGDVPPRHLSTASAESSLTSVASRFPLPWSAYARLLSLKNPPAGVWRIRSTALTLFLCITTLRPP